MDILALNVIVPTMITSQHQVTTTHIQVLLEVEQEITPLSLTTMAQDIPFKLVVVEDSIM